MILEEIKYFQYSFHLKSEFKNSSTSIKKREGFIISARDEFKNISYGEASPLENFSVETLKEIENDLQLITSKRIILSENIFEASNQIKELTQLHSLRFALEQIFLNLLFIRNNKLPDVLSGKNFKKEIYVNAVLGIYESAFIINEIKKKFNLGYKTFKIKVGRNDIQDDLSLVDSIYKNFGDKIKIRLDANGKWEFNEALNFLENLEKYEIEYIEEPCFNLDNNLKLIEHTRIKIALDESITNIAQAKQIIDNSKIEFIIIKPMIYGSIFDIIDLINYAESKNKFIIISSAFESNIGKSALVLLASLTSHTYAHGLDVADIFSNNFDDFYKVNNGRINFNIDFFPPRYDL